MNRKDLGRFFGLANQSCTSRLVLILVLFLLAVELTIGEKEAGKREKMWGVYSPGYKSFKVYKGSKDVLKSKLIR